uniref:Uncharacterized protein n=1 Tax=Arundo donax TaxID=35708 RepID=A0A0A9A3V0_ARUDO
MCARTSAPCSTYATGSSSYQLIDSLLMLEEIKCRHSPSIHFPCLVHCPVSCPE